MPQSSFSAKLPPTKPHNVTRRSREYLTAEEVDLLIRTARRQGRYGPRNATLILLMYRHALRVAEVVRLQWDMLDLKAASCTSGKPRHHFIYTSADSSRLC